MTDTTTEAVPAHLAVTLQIPMDQLLAAYTAEVPPYRGPDEDGEEPPRVLDAIGERVAQILAGEQRKEVRSLVREVLAASIKDQVESAVRDAMNAPVQPTNRFGQPNGKPTSLTEIVEAEVKEWLTKPTGDYGRQQTNLSKFVTAEVDKAIKADLDGALKQARIDVTARLREKAAEVITTTIGSMRL